MATGPHYNAPRESGRKKEQYKTQNNWRGQWEGASYSNTHTQLALGKENQPTRRKGNGGEGRGREGKGGGEEREAVAPWSQRLCGEQQTHTRRHTHRGPQHIPLPSGTRARQAKPQRTLSCTKGQLPGGAPPPPHHLHPCSCTATPLLGATTASGGGRHGALGLPCHKKVHRGEDATHATLVQRHCTRDQVRVHGGGAGRGQPQELQHNTHTAHTGTGTGRRKETAETAVQTLVVPQSPPTSINQSSDTAHAHAFVDVAFHRACGRGVW